MYGIYWAAVVVTAATWFMTAWLTQPAAWGSCTRERNVLMAFVVSLPLSALVSEYVKAPIIGALESLPWPGRSGATPWGFLLLVLWVAPFTEEAAKLLPLAVPDIRGLLDRPASPLKYGMASGLGFGIGEAWYLAWGISHSQAHARLPFYYFTAYMTERVVVSFAHGVMTSVSMAGVAAGGASAARGYLGAVALHAMLNVGALLYQARLAGPYAPHAAMVASLIVLAVVFERLKSAALEQVQAGGAVVRRRR